MKTHASSQASTHETRNIRHLTLYVVACVGCSPLTCQGHLSTSHRLLPSSPHVSINELIYLSLLHKYKQSPRESGYLQARLDVLNQQRAGLSGLQNDGGQICDFT